MLASGMITSTVDALKRRGRFQEERRRSTLEAHQRRREQILV